jgi:ABC-2 type transport system permease protein
MSTLAPPTAGGERAPRALGGPSAGGYSRAELRRDLGLLGWQVLYEQRAFWRNRRRALASLGFPLMFLLIFGGIVHGRLKSAGNVPFIDFYVPGMIAYAAMVIGFNNMSMSVALLRHEGILKRVRATPMPWSLFLGGVVLNAVLVVTLATVLLLAIGLAFYGATVRVAALPGLVVTVALGTAAFAALGIAASRLIPRPDSGMPVLMFLVLPISFISNVFFPIESGTLKEIGSFFPLWHVSHGLRPAFEPWAHGAGLTRGDIVSLAIWTAVGLVVMVRAMRSLSAKD